MAQILFGSDPTPANGDLDANFTELYNKTAWSTSGIGYATGAGGAMTQLTSKGTAVTLNKASGQITMHNAALAGGATVAFVFNNSFIASTDQVLVSFQGGSAGNITTYSCRAGLYSAGSCQIALKNETGGSLSEAVVLNFLVIKGVTA